MLRNFNRKVKELFNFFRFSVCPFRVASTSKVWFLSFLTDFAVPIIALIVSQ